MTLYCTNTQRQRRFLIRLTTSRLSREEVDEAYREAATVYEFCQVHVLEVGSDGGSVFPPAESYHEQNDLMAV